LLNLLAVEVPLTVARQVLLTGVRYSAVKTKNLCVFNPAAEKSCATLFTR